MSYDFAKVVHWSAECSSTPNVFLIEANSGMDNGSQLGLLLGG
jgi:hypothetical protein